MATIDPKIMNVISSYIEARTGVIKQTGGVFFQPNTTKELTVFDNMVNAHHKMLAEYLPAMNLQELEALTELLNSRLAYIRMHQMPGKYRG